MTLDEFGQAIKAKYPAYASKSDFEVGKAAFDKYPDAYKHLIDDRSTDQVPPVQTLGSQLSRIPQNVQDTAVGMAKDVVRTGKDLTTTALNALNKSNISGQNVTKSPGQAATNLIPSSTYISKNKAERVGQGIADTAQIAGGVLDAGANVLDAVKGNSLDQALKLTTEDLSKGAKEDVSAMSGKVTKEGKALGAETKGTLRSVKPLTTGKDMEIAKTIQPLVDQGLVKATNTVTDNISAINQEISRVSEQEIKPMLANDKRVFAPQNVEAKLKEINPTDKLVKADKSLQNVYNLVKDTMVENVKKMPGNAQGLWDANIQFGKDVKAQFGSATFDPVKQNAVSSAVTDMHNAIRDLIGENNPGYKPALTKLSNMFTAVERMAPRAAQELGTNIIERAPIIKGAAKALGKIIKPF